MVHRHNFEFYALVNLLKYLHPLYLNFLRLLNLLRKFLSLHSLCLKTPWSSYCHTLFFCRHRYPSFRVFYLVFCFTIFYGFFQDGECEDTIFPSENSHFYLPTIYLISQDRQNSTKVLDFSILLRYTAQRQKRRNCKYRLHFRKSVQGFAFGEVCPTFWDRPPSEAAISPWVFSLTTAMQILRFEKALAPI